MKKSMKQQEIDEIWDYIDNRQHFSKDELIEWFIYILTKQQRQDFLRNIKRKVENHEW